MVGFFRDVTNVLDEYKVLTMLGKMAIIYK